MSPSSSATQRPSGRARPASAIDRRACGAARAPAARSGSVVPSPGSLSTAIVASCASTIALTIVSPSPVPWMWRRSASSARYMRSNSRARSSSAIPIPVSATSSAIPRPGRAAILTATRPPLGGELDRVRDQVLEHLSEPVRGRRRPPAPRSARGRARPRPSRPPGARPRPSPRRSRRGRRVPSSISNVPAVIRVSSSRSPTRLSSRRELRSITSTKRRPCVAQVLGLDLGEQLGVADDRGQRRAQLVRDQAEELVLEPLGVALGGDVAARAHHPASRRRRRRPADPATSIARSSPVGHHDPVSRS